MGAGRSQPGKQDRQQRPRRYGQGMEAQPMLQQAQTRHGEAQQQGRRGVHPVQRAA